jgi:hypothetical protein
MIKNKRMKIEAKRFREKLFERKDRKMKDRNMGVGTIKATLNWSNEKL